MSVPASSKTWVLHVPPVNDVSDDTWIVETRAIPELNDGQVLVKVSHFSNDPAQRGWMQADTAPERFYVVPIVKGDAMRSHGLATVVASKSLKFAVGDRVLGSMYWSEWCVLNDSGRLEKIPMLPPHLSPTLPMSVFGGTWMAAYFGLYGAGEVKTGQSVLVSGAAGATGGAVIQIAKHLAGCSRVVGIAGGEEKCRFVTEVLGADLCLDYKSPTFKEDIKSIDEVDLYFDNVGGSVLDNALLRVRKNGRISLCGSISSYNDRSNSTFQNWFEIIANRLTLKGFIASDYAAEHPAAKARIIEAILADKLVLDGIETVVKASFEEIPSVWRKLFTGENKGKLMTELI